MTEVIIYFGGFMYNFGQKDYAPQVRPNRDSNPWPLKYDRTFYVTETPALTTQPSVYTYPIERCHVVGWVSLEGHDTFISTCKGLQCRQFIDAFYCMVSATTRGCVVSLHLVAVRTFSVIYDHIVSLMLVNYQIRHSAKRKWVVSLVIPDGYFNLPQWFAWVYMG